jgi:predicted DNA-binding protein
MAKPFRVSDEIHQGLKEYSEQTGVPMSRVVNDAMGDWLKTVGAARLEHFKKEAPGTGANVIEMRPQEAFA